MSSCFSKAIHGKRSQIVQFLSLVISIAIAGLLVMVILVVRTTSGIIYCYSCISTHPGCGLDTFRYSWHHSRRCPRPDDRCVKLIEQRGSEVVITRDCLSHFEGHRVDIPPVNQDLFCDTLDLIIIFASG